MKTQSITAAKLSRIFALILAASLLFSACQIQVNLPASATQTPEPGQPTAAATDHPTDAAPQSPTPTPTMTALETQLKGLQIHFWHPWSGGLSKEIDLLVDQFNQTNEWGVHVIVTRAGSSMALASQVDAAASSGELPQVVVAPSEQLLTWLERDQRMVILDKFIDDSVWGLSEQQRAEFGLVFWLQDQSQDQQIGIPAQRSAQVMFYNQTWAKQLGFDSPPQTAEEFRAQACAAAKANLADSRSDNDGMGGWILDTDGLTIYSWLRAFDFENAAQGDPPKFVFDQPQALQAFDFLRGLVDEGCAWIARNPAPQEYFANRQALFYTASLLDIPLQVSMQAQTGSQDEWTVLPFPGVPRPTVVVSGLSYGILRSSPENELAAWLFVRWMSSADNQARLLKAGGGLPLTPSAYNLADGAILQIPQWAATMSWIPLAQPAPQSADWRVARYILADAAWRAMQSSVPPEQIPQILKELDATIAEVLAKQN